MSAEPWEQRMRRAIGQIQGRTLREDFILCFQEMDRLREKNQKHLTKWQECLKEMEEKHPTSDVTLWVKGYVLG